MPAGKRSGPGDRRLAQGRGGRMLLRPSLLLLLLENDSYGYEILDNLGDFGFNTECLDPSIIYRDLREMEQEGLISSFWDENSKGPRRRVYQIDQPGRELLQERIDRLKHHQERIQGLVDRYHSLDERFKK
jgi:PadR family transcriptional regulator PadR